MNLAVQTTAPQLHTTSHSLVEMAANHIQAATRITDITDLRYFTMRDLQQVRTNLHLALELLAASSHRKVGDA